VGALGAIPGARGEATTQSLNAGRAARLRVGRRPRGGRLGHPPAVGAKPPAAHAGRRSGGAGAGAALGGILGRRLPRSCPRFARAQAAVAADEQVQRLAAALETTPPAGRKQVLALLRERINQLNQPQPGVRLHRAVRTIEDQFSVTTPRRSRPPSPDGRAAFPLDPAERPLRVHDRGGRELPYPTAQRPEAAGEARGSARSEALVDAT